MDHLVSDIDQTKRVESEWMMGDGAYRDDTPPRPLRVRHRQKDSIPNRDRRFPARKVMVIVSFARAPYMGNTTVFYATPLEIWRTHLVAIKGGVSVADIAALALVSRDLHAWSLDFITGGSLADLEALLRNLEKTSGGCGALDALKGRMRESISATMFIIVSD